MGWIDLTVALLNSESQSQVMNAPVMENMRDHMAVTVPQMIARRSSGKV